jgi:hypothetical protein
MTTTNILGISQDGIPIFSTLSGNFQNTIPPEDQALVGGPNGTILGVDPTGHDVGNPLCNTGVGTPPNYSATPTVDSLTIINNPSNPTDATNKQYVDLIASNFSFLDATLCATTANLNASYSNGVDGVGATLTNSGTFQAFSVDNYNPVVTNRVLIKDQTNAYENGVYEITVLGDSLTAWVLTRTLDYDQPSEIIPGSLVSVLYGDTNGDTIWAETQQITTIGTDPIQFVQFNSGSQGALLAVNNLSDVQDVATSRSNLGLTNVATQNVTQYSVLIGDATDNIYSLPVGSFGQLLACGGVGQNPFWQTYSPPTSFVWQNVVNTGMTMQGNNGYIINNTSLVTLSMPASAQVGELLWVVGNQGSWKIQLNPGQIVNFGNKQSNGGSISSSVPSDAIQLVCVVNNTTFNCTGVAQGNMVVV